MAQRKHWVQKLFKMQTFVPRRQWRFQLFTGAIQDLCQRRTSTDHKKATTGISRQPMDIQKTFCATKILAQIELGG